LIGAGGLGEPIISGLDLNDHVTIFSRVRSLRLCSRCSCNGVLICLIAFSFQKDFVYRVARASGVLSQAEKLALHLINANRFYHPATGEKVKEFSPFD